MLDINSLDLLIIIDPQDGFRYVESEKIIPKIQDLLVNWTGKISFSLFNNSKNSNFEKWLAWTKFQTQMDREVWNEIDDFESARFWHNSYSVITPEVLDFIRINKIERVFLAGIYTDVCVIKASMDLFDLNIEPFVIENCCCSLHSKTQHEAAIISLQHIIGKDRILSI